MGGSSVGRVIKFWGGVQQILGGSVKLLGGRAIVPEARYTMINGHC